MSSTLHVHNLSIQNNLYCFACLLHTI